MKIETMKYISAIVILYFTLVHNVKPNNYERPPSPRPKDPRLELQQIFDGNGVVYNWKGYIVNPASNDKQEITIDDKEKVYRISDSNSENLWLISLQQYSQIDRLNPQPKGVRVCLKEIQHPKGTEKPHFEFDISGQVVVAMTLDCNSQKPFKSTDPKSIASENLSMLFVQTTSDPKMIGSSRIVTAKSDCQNCVYVENSAFTHPDRYGGPDVASHTERTLFSFRKTVNEVRIYQDPLDPSLGEPNGGAWAWQGDRTNPALSIFKNRHDTEGQFGVVFTIPRGYEQPDLDGAKSRTGGLTSLLRGDERDSNKKIRNLNIPAVTP